jgi:agmatine deiminase
MFRELKMHRRAHTKVNPHSFGYRMPAEWEPHEATWLAWPHELTDWPGKFAPIPWVYAEIVRHLSRVERVRILIEGAEAESRVRAMLRKSGANLSAVKFWRAPTNRGWIRDFGPIFIKNAAGKVAATHWVFNGWAKYDDFPKDAAAFARVNRKLRHSVWRPALGDRPIVLEGGSIDVNGRGTLMTTEECLLSPVQARNLGLGRGELESILCDYLGATNVIWLKNGIVGDDTHGHVDDLARFVNPATVIVVTERDGADPNYAPLRENLRLLHAARDQNGRPLRVVELPMPAPVFFDGQRLPASYANFYIANRLVLVPVFSDPYDRGALNILAGLFPGREVIGIPCRDLVLGLGTLHCMTQQEPARG